MKSIVHTRAISVKDKRPLIWKIHRRNNLKHDLGKKAANLKTLEKCSWSVASNIETKYITVWRSILTSSIAKGFIFAPAIFLLGFLLPTLSFVVVRFRAVTSANSKNPFTDEVTDEVVV